MSNGYVFLGHSGAPFLFLDNKDIRNISKPKITFYHIKGGTFYEVKATTFNEVLVINP